MHASYHSSIHRLNSKLEKLVNSLNGLSHQQLNKQPEPGAWSILQVMQHVMLAEKLSVGYVRKKTSRPETLKKAGFGYFFRYAVLKIFLALPFKFKAPAVVSEDKFPEESNFEKVVAEWKMVRSDLVQLLEGIHPSWQDKEIFKHAVAGRMTLDGMLTFFEDHFDRHLKQIERTAKVVSA